MGKLTILLIFSLILLPLVSSQPPVTFSSADFGYTLASIEPPITIGQNTTTHLHIHVLNNTNSQYVNSSITCFYHLSNPVGQKINEGFLTVSTTSVTANVSYSATINGGNFSTNGLYNVLIGCFDEGKFAGITRVLIDVTPTGFNFSVYKVIPAIWAGLLILFITAGFFYIARTSEGLVKKATFYSLSVICLIILILYTIILNQQVLYEFPKIVEGIENFWFIIKMLITVGIVSSIIYLFLIFLKLWKVKRGLEDD